MQHDDPGASAQTLQTSEVRYRRLFESARDGILIVDADSGQVIDVNPYLAELLGYRVADFIGKRLWDFVSFRDVVATKEAFEVLRAHDYVAYEDIPLERSDGHHVDVGFVSNVYLVDGKRTIQCNIRDISERKALERARIDLENQLRASQKMEAIGRLAGGIAHDFNNLLGVVLGFAGLALEALPVGSPIRDDLMEVEKASKRAANLVRQLLAFSRQQVLQPILLDLNQVVGGLEKMLRRVLGEHIELEHSLARDLGATMADPGQIEQVIMNLVLNARDAMPDGGKLVIETANVELDPELPTTHAPTRPGPYVMIAVTDTGSGMDAETLARVYEPFFTTKGPARGTGLGLSTVYGIVKQSGGNIWVYSELGHGTTFKVYLPRDFTALPANDGDGRRSRPARWQGGSETILVVEDNEQVLHLAQRILGAAGYEVLTARNGPAALAVCEGHTADLPLVLTDVVMPQMSGPSLATELRRLRPELKVLFMSGYSDAAVRQGGKLEARTRFIGKPFSAPELTRKIRELLDEGPA